jgi:predicted nuclease of predicted toxin-antitoxin system
MKQKLISLFIVGVVGLSMLSCSSAKANSNNRFILTNDTYQMGGTYSVCYDSKTKIVYLVAINMNTSGITVMYNSEGKPMTIDEYNKTK